MSRHVFKIGFKFVAVLFGILSAASWAKSAFVKTRRTKGDSQHEGGTQVYADGSVTINGDDLSELLLLQSRYNGIGAFCAATAIILQIISDAIPA
jgi:hypothetical protein